MIRLSRAGVVDLREIERLSSAMTRTLMVHVGFETLYRESLDSRKVAEPRPRTLEPFQTITTADIDAMLQG